jgi:hypothetical protein
LSFFQAKGLFTNEVYATFDRPVSFQLTTFSRNPYLYGDGSQFVNTPLLKMEVKDNTNKPPAPSIFSGGSAMTSTINSQLNEDPKDIDKVRIEDMPKRGKVHSIECTSRHGYLRFNFRKNFPGNATLLGQMDIQPGDVDFDFKYVISDVILSAEVKQGCKIVTNRKDQDYSFFIYNSCFKKLGQLKILFKLASGEYVFHLVSSHFAISHTV